LKIQGCGVKTQKNLTKKKNRNVSVAQARRLLDLVYGRRRKGRAKAGKERLKKTRRELEKEYYAERYFSQRPKLVRPKRRLAKENLKLCEKREKTSWGVRGAGL